MTLEDRIEALEKLLYQEQVKRTAHEIFIGEYLGNLSQVLKVKFDFTNYATKQRAELLELSKTDDVRFDEDVLSEIESIAQQFGKVFDP